MLQSRTVRTLTTLFTAMIVGALSLMWMETAPIDELSVSLTAFSSSPISDEKVVYDTRVPVSESKWRHIVVTNAPTPDHNTARACHFIVSNGEQAVSTTDLWKDQYDGYHTFAPGNDWNSDSIGVCFLGNLNDGALGARQFNELMALVQTLQHHFKVRPERVYFRSELDERSVQPSEAFVRAFSRGLLRRPSDL